MKKLEIEVFTNTKNPKVIKIDNIEYDEAAVNEEVASTMKDIA